MFRKPKFDVFRGKGMSGPPRGGDIGKKSIGGRGLRGQGSGGCQGRRAHCVQ